MHRICLIIGLVVCGLLAGPARGETFKLTNGQEITGEALLSSGNEQGMQIKTGEGEYQRVPWANFTQLDLKKFAQNKKLEPLVEPFIEISQEEKIKKTEVAIQAPPRLDRPARQSLFAAFFSSGLGVFVMLMLYGANIWAGYEVAIFRAQPTLLVAGLSAIPLLGFVAPIAFLWMPTKLKPSEEVPEAAAEAVPVSAAAAATEETVNPMQANGAVHPTSLHIAHAPAEAAKSALPEKVKYQRGQFTFNRRFLETKFPNFFSVVRREADKDMVLVIKSARGEYVGQRISRIAANDFHLQVQKGPASEEIMIPYQEIKEIILRHKDDTSA